jgi:hypothetical protein
MGRSACLIDRHTLRGGRRPYHPTRWCKLYCRCWSAAREACRSVCLLDLVDAGVGAAEIAWAARACDGLDGGRSSGCGAVPWSRNPGQAADRRRRCLVWVGLSLALRSWEWCCDSSTATLAAQCWCRTCCRVPGCASVGVLVAVRRRGHRIGWLFLGMGLAAALTGFSFEYAVRAGVTAPGSLPAGWLLAAIAAWTWPLSFAGLGFLPLLFPGGRLPSPRWRPVAWALAVCTAWLTTGTSN